MTACFDYKNKGITIQFQTRGISIEESVHLWQSIDPVEILDLTKETGHNLITYKNRLCLEIVKKGKNIVVRCGKI